jgi:lactoylglutathione lyase
VNRFRLFRINQGEGRIQITLLAIIFLALSHTASFAQFSAIGGPDHIGLTVTDLDATTTFSVDTLGFEVLGRDPGYPSVFLSNDDIIITLWRASDSKNAITFDRKKCWTAYLVLKISSFDMLDDLHEQLKTIPGVRIEFAPEPLSGVPTKYMMILEPNGNRWSEYIGHERSGQKSGSTDNLYY